MAVGKVQDYSPPTQSREQPGKLGDKKVIPASHNAQRGGISLAGLMFVLGIILWAVGASQGMAGMEIAGKVLFGLSFIPLVIGCCYICALGGSIAAGLSRT